MVIPGETPIPLYIFSLKFNFFSGGSSPKFEATKLVNKFKSSAEFNPLQIIVILEPFVAASVIKPSIEEPFTVLLPLLTDIFDCKLEAILTNLAAALACKPSLLVICIFFLFVFNFNL